MDDYLVSKAKAEDYFLEYLKFVYVCLCTNEDQTPSIEVDMMWHYHHEQIENYVRFSNDALKLKVFVHDTGDNSPKVQDFYLTKNAQTQVYIRQHFENHNEQVWGNRVYRGFRWLNHFDIID
jgi:hypothetical protein